MVILAAPPSFSVVIPTYNRATLVGRAIDSALAQTIGATEIIVVDDGSTDDTETILRSYGDRITVFRQANAGCSAARNHGVRASRGEWVAFLDSDDTWAPDHLESMADAIRSTDGRADLYFSDSRFDAAEGGSTLWSVSGFAIEGKTALEADGTGWVLAPRQPMKLQCSVFRRELYEAVGGLDESLRTREDTHFFLKAGIGRPLCAVRSGGVEIGIEDDPNNRLTLAHPPGERTYLEATVHLYQDVVCHARRNSTLSAAELGELKDRLGAARVRLARLDLRDGRLLAFAWGVLVATGTSPRTLLGMVGRRLRRLAP
ncbi:MAG: glycosyltransferase family 2 protein [Planctomycetes bacterium]|nr:glycosyltransferase family 2 protein [Planctomycetota bacterium]MCB9917914.1 glycosyltransferase family 2 protein [Planctomycetota bacterium]